MIIFLFLVNSFLLSWNLYLCDKNRKLEISQKYLLHENRLLHYKYRKEKEKNGNNV